MDVTVLSKGDLIEYKKARIENVQYGNKWAQAEDYIKPDTDVQGSKHGRDTMTAGWETLL